jgi:hypothetical protein
MRQKRRDDFVNREKLILLVTFRAIHLAPKQQNRPT